MMSSTAIWSWKSLIFRPSCTAPRKNMARRPRQTTKGTTVKNRMGTVRTTPLCLWSIREKGQKPCWNLGLQCPRPGTPGFGSNLLYMDLPSDLRGSDARRRVAIERCKPCANPHDSGDMPKYLPAGLTQYVLNNFSETSPPYHVTQDDVSTPIQRLAVEQITGHQSVRGRGGVIAVLYRTHLAGLSEPSWEREMDLHLSRPHILLGRNPGPTPPNQPPLPPNADRGGTARAFSQQRDTFPSAGLRLCSPRRLAPSLPRHGAS